LAIEPDATDIDTEAAAQRLDAALDRIAASRPAPDGNTSAIAAGLDRMISRLRDELATDPQN
jgi:hypothetical protein